MFPEFQIISEKKSFFLLGFSTDCSLQLQRALNQSFIAEKVELAVFYRRKGGLDVVAVSTTF